MFASLTPWNSGVQKVDRFAFLKLPSFDDIFLLHDLRDITTNVLLYLPLGIFLSLAVCKTRPRLITPWLLTGSALSLIMETLQSFIGRTSDVVDIVTNSTGFIVGFWITVISVRYYGLRPAVLIGIDPDDESNSKVKTIAALRFLYVCVFFIVALLPFKITVTVSEIYSQLLPDAAGNRSIILDPLFHFRQLPGSILNLMLTLLGFIPVGILTAFLDLYRGRFSVLSPISFCLVLAVISEGAQVFIISRTSDIITLPLAIIAGIIGWIAVRYWTKLQDIHAEDSPQPEYLKRKATAIALISYAVFLCLLAWSPYHFETNRAVIFKKIFHQSNLRPFRIHFANRDLSSAVDLVKETGIFIPMGMLIAFFLTTYHRNMSRWKAVILSAILCSAFATFLELSQGACIGRYVDSTDVILGGMGGIAGVALFRLFSRKSQLENQYPEVTYQNPPSP
jgi:glycopeptide antibiotics resistance protein